MKPSEISSIPRRFTHARRSARGGFDYSLPYRRLNLRERPELYRVGVGEQGVLLVEPYKSEILPHWRFRDPAIAEKSARKILALFRQYRAQEDFVGMDMARKFLQMGFTRARRYANHADGRKYDSQFRLRPFRNDAVKAKSAEIFWDAWKEVEADSTYSVMKVLWKGAFG